MALLIDVPPDVTDYPQPRLPVHPVLSMDCFHGAKSAKVASLLDVGPAVFFASGRFALAEALRLSGVSKDDEVLLPAYNCPAMVAPIAWLGARPRFYRVHENLTPDLADISSRRGDRIKALIVVHYFGFIRELAKLRKWCDDHHVLLIEDCAHSLFGESASQPVGSVGDYAFGSLMKFFPLYDGGVLVSRRLKLDGALRGGGLKFELKSGLDAIERAHQYQKLPFSRLFGAALGVKKALRSRSAVRKSIGPASSEGGYAFEAEWSDVRMSACSRWITGHVSQLRLVEKRRRNYELLVEALNSIDGCAPLFENLPEGVVPYVFPLYVENPDPVFSRLKNAGVPLLRWEDAVVDPCPISARYAQHLFLLPCHQELSENDMRWISDSVSQALQMAS